MLARPSAKIKQELQLLMDADSLAFFRHTVGYFVETKAKKYSSDWIWTRITTNVKRLRRVLRLEAVKYMEALSDEVKLLMGWKPDELYALCGSLTETTVATARSPSMDSVSAAPPV